MTAPSNETIQPDETERTARLRLIRSENVGPITFHRLMERYGTATDALDALPELARRGGKKTVRICTHDRAIREIEALEKAGGCHIHFGSVGYPPLLTQIDDAPPVLSVLGHHALLGKKSVAVVGARNASTNGRQLARQFASALGAAGYLVVSGMARGIDAAAHDGALATGTVAVMGGGADVIYPRENETLYGHLIQTGAIIAEMPIGTKPKATHFPRRNRIISGMARGIVIIEAGAKSGSLITARMALEQGREVFAIPGAPQDPRVKGTNMLIRDGAMLTETADDVISLLRDQDTYALCDHRSNVPAPPIKTALNVQGTKEIQADLCQLLNYGPTDVDDIIRENGFDPSDLAGALLELELAGRLERLPGNRVCLIAH